MDIDAIVARLAEATDAELSEALSAIGTEARALATEASTEENVTKLEAYAAAKLAIEGAQTQRAELAARGDAARAAFGDETTPPEPVVPDAEVVETETEETEAVTASAMGAISKTVAKRTAPAAVAQFAGQVTARAISTGSTASFNAGVQFDSNTLSEALAEKWQGVHKSGVQGRQTVARIQYDYPESRKLSSAVAYGVNNAVIAAATSPESLVAAGGLCAPLENLYDINVLGVTTRPVRDALTRFQVDRGGIQYRPPMDALAMTDGLGVWTIAMDQAVGVIETPTDIPDPAKTCAVIDCPDLETAVVDAIYLCLQYPNFTARFDREWVDATTRAALIAHARFSENRLLAKLFAGSKLLTSPVAVSATRDVLVTLDKVIAYYRNRHRLDSLSPLRWIAPRWVLDLFRADICRSLSSVHDPAMFGVADTVIQGWFRARGVNATFHLDGLATQVVTPPGAGLGTVPDQFYANAAAGSVVPPFIDKIDSLLFAEGDWLFLDGGTLDLGLVRDSQLNSINRYQTFVEAWEGVAFNGIESLRLLMSVQPSGGVVGTIPPALTD